MAVTKLESKHRTKLNTEQLEILKLLNKFRYGSKELVTQYLGKKDPSYVFRRLEVLVSLGLIAKRYENSYRLLGKPAAYYLTPAGAKSLQESKSIDINMKLIYKSKTTSESFISHSLNIFGVRNQLKAKYGDTLGFFTKTDLRRDDFDYFPNPLPDAFLSTNKDEKRFFIEVIDESKPFFAVSKRIKEYIRYEESGEWEETNTDFPALLFICPTDATRERVIKQATRMNIGFTLATTVRTSLAGITVNDRIWRSLTEPSIAVSINQLAN